MAEIIGVRFKDGGKTYYFSPGEIEIHVGENVIVETSRGEEYGRVIAGRRQIDDGDLKSPLKNVIRAATKNDDEIYKTRRIKEKEAFSVCLEKIRDNGLQMKLVDVEYTFDGTKIIFYFTADGRVDFRQLVKDLAAVFRTRIELRQIGVRDETKALGSYGICGRNLCCSQFLDEFVPVSIKMAKEQGLSLNPGKISGVCGRLMCCLKYEQDTYEELNRLSPKRGAEVKTPDGIGTVDSVSILKGLVKVRIETETETVVKEFNVSDITQTGAAKKNTRPAKKQ